MYTKQLTAVSVYVCFLSTGSRNKIQSLMNHYTLWMSATDWTFAEESKKPDGRAHIAHFDVGQQHKTAPAKLMGKPRQVSATPNEFQMLLETWATKIPELDKMLDKFKRFIEKAYPSNTRKRTDFAKEHPEKWTPQAWSSAAWTKKGLTPQQQRLKNDFSGKMMVHPNYCDIL